VTVSRNVNSDGNNEEIMKQRCVCVCVRAVCAKGIPAVETDLSQMLEYIDQNTDNPL
jgi:hypothetical protein